MWEWIPRLRHYFFKGEKRLNEPKPEALFLMMVKQLASAPPSQLDIRLSRKCLELTRNPAATQATAYDLLVEINESCGCEMSSFVKTLTDVKKYYTRPGGIET